MKEFIQYGFTFINEALEAEKEICKEFSKKLMRLLKGIIKL